MKITYSNVVPLKEAGREAARLVVIAILPLLYDSLNKWSIDWRAIAVVGGIAFLRFVDKYLHLRGKLESDKKLTRGLVQF